MSNSDSGLRTPLFEEHKALGARIIDFGGWQMPVQYRAGIIKEHTAVREAAGIFDVSHMGEARISGARAAEAVQRLVTNNVGAMVDGAAMYTVMCYPDGGIVDDCIVYRRAEDHYFIVLNASNTAKDLAWIREQTETQYQVEIADLSPYTALIAVQGPQAVATVAGLAATDSTVLEVAPFHFIDVELAGVPCIAARTGYTGEDGFELACPAERAAALWTALLDAGRDRGLLPCGLGARDTLRLEARLSLYGNDIDQTTTPYEAGLGWVVKPDAGDFIGRDALLAQKAKGVPRRLIGFRITGRGIARSGYAIRDAASGAEIGRVTSGTKGPTVGAAIGLGYVPPEHAAAGSELIIDCRGKDAAATVVKGKFYRRKRSS